jgi:hypothetical protein
LENLPKAELSIGRSLTWLITDLPDHFMNLVVFNPIPSNEIIGVIILYFPEILPAFTGLKIIPTEHEIYTGSIGFRSNEEFKRVLQGVLLMRHLSTISVKKCTYVSVFPTSKQTSRLVQLNFAHENLIFALFGWTRAVGVGMAE